MKKILVFLLVILLISGCSKKEEEKFASVVGVYFMPKILDMEESESKKYQEEEYFLFTEDLYWEHQYNTCEGYILYYGTYRYFNYNEEKMLELTIKGYKTSEGKEEEIDNKVMYFNYTSDSITFKEVKFDLEKESILKNATTTGCGSFGETTWVKMSDLVKNLKV